MFNEPDKLLKAIANVTFDNMLAVHDIRLLDTGDKMFIAMPNKKISEGTYKDVIHPVNQQGRDLITNAVISAYQKALEEQPESTAVN